MPLRDHFHPPVSHRLPWETLHSGWLGELAVRLNAILPPEYVALETIRVGGRLEIDVGTFEEHHTDTDAGGNGVHGGVAVAPALYTPPVATGTFPVSFPDVAEVRVYSDRGGRKLVGAIELVSPGNKDRGGEREVFASKCAAYLTAGASLIVVDVVTDRRGVLHNDILRALAVPPESELPDDETLYAVAYRPVRRDGKTAVDVWCSTFSVGDVLPTLPLRLVADLFVPVELEATYTDACRRRRLS